MDNFPQPKPRRRGALAVAACLGFTISLLALGLGFSPAASGAVGDTIQLYDDEIAPGFENWSWGQNDTNSTAEVHEGDRAIAFTPNEWEGFYIARNDSQPLPAAGELRFALNGGSNDGALLNVVLSDTAGESAPVPIALEAGTWTTHVINLEDFGGLAAFNGVWFQEGAGSALATVYIDDVEIVELAPPPAANGPRLIVDLGERAITRTVTDPGSGVASDYTITFPHDISEDIYGMNFVTDAVREELDVPVNRWGGNSTERYNHTNGSTNLGQDWYFMNAPDDEGADHDFERANQEDGTSTILTLPMIGYVAKDRNASCSYPTSDVLGAAANAGAQDDAQPNNVDPSFECGNGVVGGEQLGGADPAITSTPADETFAASWVQELVNTHGPASAGGVEIYALGNEPGLWYSTHRDVHPDPLSRVELIDKNKTWAAAVKAVDPSAQVAGPVLWSGNSYYTTTDEMLAGLRPGDVRTFSGEYLAEMRAASEAAGIRLLDQFAVNFYDDRVYGQGSDALRLEATRQLWDPSYAPQDWWVARDFLKGDGSAVVPRLNTLIDQNYPGTKLAITEYNFGGNDTIAGALAQADALGIFGREGLDTATIWDPYAFWTGLTEAEWGDRPVIDAFRLYRNYDGEGSAFGDVSHYAESSDEGAVAIHAAVRTSDEALTILVINKSRRTLESPLMIEGRGGIAERYLYDATTGGAVQDVGTTDVRGDINELVLPARSATLLVIPETGAPDPEPRVVATNGAVLIDAPLTTAEGGELDSDDAMYVWQEQGPTVLASALEVDVAQPGNFRGGETTRSQISAGTTICSWFIFGDRADDNGRLDGTIEFRGQTVLGIATRARSLNRSSLLGAAGTTYGAGPLEQNDRGEWTRSAGADSVSIRMWFGPHTDAIRVVTDCG